MDDGTFLVGTYNDVMTAHLVRSRLELEGIQVTLMDENMLTMDPLLTFAIGGIKVLVPAADAKAAREVVARSAAPRVESTCPACNSTHIKRHRSGRRSAFLTLIFLGFPFGRARPKARCEDCHHTWREPS
ncbi:MAG TPA: DUF2007 domain-containing protein [Planctomycetota bacterium]|nr:DUF2007 domain-containing protein [Planctomycetota bacterium]